MWTLETYIHLLLTTQAAMSKAGQEYTYTHTHTHTHTHRERERERERERKKEKAT